jgi:HPt (histidine-containing phosphotransfer) domain-containing protein
VIALSAAALVDDQRRALAAVLRSTGDVLDMALISQLRAIDDTGAALAELSSMFFERAPERLGQLRRSVELADVDAVRDLAHDIKGSAANLAMRPLATTCEVIESAARGGRLPDARDVDRLGPELQSAQEAYAAVVATSP